MGMREAIDAVNSMVERRIIGKYAIGGAVAALNYIEPFLTDDLDILISFDDVAEATSSGLVMLTPILSYLKEKGYYEFRNEGVVVGGWTVQFLPVADDLDAEALEMADELTIEIGVGPLLARVLRAEHVVATALRVGRPKDLIRITQFLDQKKVEPVKLRAVLARHGLRPKWDQFCSRVGVPNPFGGT